MATEVKVPVLPESVSDALIAAWHKKVGDAVKRDENLLDLEVALNPLEHFRLNLGGVSGGGIRLGAEFNARKGDSLRVEQISKGDIKGLGEP